MPSEISETRSCQNCKNNFTIESNDFGFYEKISVPPPTFCPDCRRQRRWAWRNNMSLYNRKCDLCNKAIISIYSPDSGLTVYCNKCWWSDKWDPKSYGVDYDFSKPFFTQFNELIKRVPHMAIVNDDGIASVNCEYSHDWWFSKNCHMCLSGWYVQDVMYSFFIMGGGKDMVDCMHVGQPTERMYECINCGKSFNLKYSELCKACVDSNFLYNCLNCTNCFLCTGLRNQKYNFKNKQYTKEEYEEIIASYKLDTFSGVERAKKEYEELVRNFPKRFGHLNQCVNCTGYLISSSKNCKDSFLLRSSENCSYVDYSGDRNNQDKDCYDVTLTGGASECYENVVGDHSQRNLFCLFSPKCMDVRYVQHCHSGKYLFGSVGMRNSSYTIFNKQYSKEEYESMVPKIIEHMNAMPYEDKAGNFYKYGEYYPIELSYFGYNESNAPEIVFLEREEALQKGYKWEDNTQRTENKETLKFQDIPESINDITDGILNEVLACINCNRNYKIIPNELIFYKKMGIPIPRKCFFCRHNARLARRNPFKLWHRECMCDKGTHFHEEGKCDVEFETSYSPERPEVVYCEKCYQAEVY
jgi:hypothetical protein